jgi:FkbM family methyltransferase
MTMDAVMKFLARNEDRFASRLGRAWDPVHDRLAAHKRTRRVVAVPFGKMDLCPQDGISGFIWAFGWWEPNISNWLRRVLKPGDGFVDLGANVGYFTLLAKHLVGDGPVWSFEASPTIYRQLRRNIALNDLAVFAHNIAISDQDGEVSIHLGDNQGEANIFGSNDYPQEARVPGRRLETLFADQDVSRVRVIKIDIEGAEDLALAGMGALWNRLPATTDFLMEISPEILGPRGVDPASLYRQFEERGYKPHLIRNDYNLYTYRRAKHYEPPAPITSPLSVVGDVIFSKTGAGNT